MTDLQQTFLAETPRRIEKLRAEVRLLRAADAGAAERILRRIFHQIHTFKGSAAAFDLDAASRIAHEAENVLEIALANSAAAPHAAAILEKAADLLNESLASAAAGRDFVFPCAEIESWRVALAEITRNEPEQNRATVGKLSLPDEIERQLSQPELERMREAAASEKKYFMFAARFDAAQFALEFQQLRARLSKTGEIIATLPHPDANAPGSVGLKIVCLANTADAAIQTAVESVGGEVLLISGSVLPAGEAKNIETSEAKIKLSDVWATALLAAQKSAQNLGKSVAFDASGGEIEVSREVAEKLEIAFLHLLRNAVFHGIEPIVERQRVGKNCNGTITVAAQNEANCLKIKIADDGRGIDRERVKQIAVARGLISNEADLNRAETERLIFQPGFSTADTLTSDAGRGIGLDAVESALQAIGGDIQIESQPGSGTTFKITVEK